MADTDLQTEGTPKTEGQQDTGDGPDLLQARTRAELVREIKDASADFGFPSLAEAVRSVMTVFARSDRVRDAVRRDLSLALTPKGEGR